MNVVQLIMKNSRPCRDLNPGPARYQADMLPIELSWLGSVYAFLYNFGLVFEWNLSVQS